MATGTATGAIGTAAPVSGTSNPLSTALGAYGSGPIGGAAYTSGGIDLGGNYSTGFPGGNLGLPSGMESSIDAFTQTGSGYNPDIVNALIQAINTYGNTQANTSLQQLGQTYNTQQQDLSQYLQQAIQQMQQPIQQGEASLEEMYGGMGLGASSPAASGMAQYLQGANLDISQLANSGALQLGQLAQTQNMSAEQLLAQNNAQLGALDASTITSSWQDAINNYLNIIDASNKVQAPSSAETVTSILGGLF